MFEWLKKFGKIIVTGPHRAGTRICSRMIAYDTGHEFIDEASLGLDSIYQISSFLRKDRSLVIQCPSLCRNVHMFNDENTAVVLMRRTVEDIVNSQKRINMGSIWEQLELGRYDRSDGVIAEVKYQFWEQNQKKHITNAFEIEYRGLSTHPLWIEDDLRVNFIATKTSHSIFTLEQDRQLRVITYPGVHYLDHLDESSAILIKVKENSRVLNDTGKFIWNLCDGKHTRENILEALKVEFEGVSDDIMASDMDQFILNLVSNGFLRFLTDSPDK